MINPPAPPEVSKPTMRDFTIWQNMKSKVVLFGYINPSVPSEVQGPQKGTSPSDRT